MITHAIHVTLDFLSLALFLGFLLLMADVITSAVGG